MYLLTMLTQIKLGQIQPCPFQTRIGLGNIESLAENMDTHGLQSPITVRPLPGDKYQLVFGTRRLAAAKLLKWEAIACFVRELTDSETAEICLSENLQRENLNSIEEAIAFKTLIDKFGYTHEQIAERVGKSRAYISNSVRLLKIDPFLQACIMTGKLNISHVRVLNTLPVEIPKYRVGDLVMDWGLTVRELEEIINSIKTGKPVLSWTREIPIDSILIPVRALNPEYSYGWGIVIIDTGRVLMGGLDKLLEAQETGESTVEAEVIYFSDFLTPSNNWVPVDDFVDDEWKPSSPFQKILAELMGSPVEMYNRYPVHLVKHDADYMVLLPRPQS